MSCGNCRKLDYKARRGWRLYFQLKAVSAEMAERTRDEIEKLKADAALPKHMVERLATISEQLRDVCPICLDNIRKENYCILRKCYHSFCSSCYRDLTENQEYETGQLTCPVCRCTVKESEVVHFT
jgi:hypothetical protein